MKKTLFSQLIAAVTIIFIPTIYSNAQISGMAPVMFAEGYVVLNTGDTLPGRLRWTLKYVENNPVEIKFLSPGGEQQTFNASEIKGFGNIVRGWDDDLEMPVGTGPEDYVSVMSVKKGVPVFMNRLIDGKVRVFQNRSSNNQTTSKIETISKFDGIGFTYDPGEGLSIGPVYRTSYRIIESRTRFSSYFVSKDEGKLVKVEKENYDTLFPVLFGDCQAIAAETEKNPDLLKFRNFMIVAEIYNQMCR